MSLSCGGRYLFLQIHFAEPLANYVMGISFFILFFFLCGLFLIPIKKKYLLAPKTTLIVPPLLVEKDKGPNPLGVPLIKQRVYEFLCTKMKWLHPHEGIHLKSE